MKVSLRSKRMARLRGWGIVALLLGAVGGLAWLSERYVYEADWTVNGRNTLSPVSLSLLQRLEGAVEIEALATDGTPLKRQIADLVARYQRHKADMAVAFFDPDTDPERLRQLGLEREGDVVVSYQDRRERLARLSEQGMTNALQRLMRAGQRWLVFIEGHGERSPFGQANFDLQLWAKQLQGKGFKIKGLNLVSDPIIPRNTSVLVIAGPQSDYLSGEVTLIEQYVGQGGNLLWLADPGPLRGLESLAEQLGVSFDPGVVVDPLTQLYGISDPTFALVADYGVHPLTRGFDKLTLYPSAAGVTAEAVDGWQADPFLTTTARAWSETGKLAGEVSFDAAEDVAGPLTLGVALSRDRSEEEAGAAQRVVVVGDGDFLSNAYLGNGGNLDLGLNLVNWLARDDQLINIPAKTARDVALELSETQSMIIAFGFLLVLPLLLLGGGVAVWWRRRKA